VDIRRSARRRFAVLGGSVSSCETLVMGEGAHWGNLAPMHKSRAHFACAAVTGCIIVAGGRGLKSAKIYDEARDRWFRLPRDLPYDTQLWLMGSALLYNMVRGPFLVPDVTLRGRRVYDDRNLLT
jgi:hypothetical protein